MTTNTIPASQLTADMILIASGKEVKIVSVTPLPNGLSIELGLRNVKAPRTARPYYMTVGVLDSVTIKA